MCKTPEVVVYFMFSDESVKSFISLILSVVHVIMLIPMLLMLPGKGISLQCLYMDRYGPSKSRRLGDFVESEVGALWWGRAWYTVCMMGAERWSGDSGEPERRL